MVRLRVLCSDHVIFGVAWSRRARAFPTALRHPVRIEATASLQHMVRNIVGTLVEIGRDERPAAMAEILASPDRRRAGRTAPPHGLVLQAVRY